MPIVPYSTEFYTIMYITIGVIVIKFLISFGLGKKVFDSKRDKAASSDFIFAVWFLLLTLAISRILYFIFDFHYTQFNMDYYYLSPHVWFWKSGMLVAGIGQFYITYILDKKIMQFKFKGIPSYLILIGNIIIFFYPVSKIEDFYAMSYIAIIANLGILVLPYIFIKMIRETTGDLKKNAIVFLIGVTVFLISALAVNASLLTALNEATGQSLEVAVYSIQAVCKIVGMIMFTYSTTKMAF